jgi:hypothetical protein
MELELFIKKCKDLVFKKYIYNYNVKTSWLTYLHNCGIADDILKEIKELPTNLNYQKYLKERPILLNHYKKQIYEY